MNARLPFGHNNPAKLALQLLANLGQLRDGESVGGIDDGASLFAHQLVALTTTSKDGGRLEQVVAKALDELHCLDDKVVTHNVAHLGESLVRLAGAEKLGNLFAGCETLCREFLLQMHESTNGHLELRLEAVNLKGAHPRVRAACHNYVARDYLRLITYISHPSLHLSFFSKDTLVIDTNGQTDERTDERMLWCCRLVLLLHHGWNVHASGMRRSKSTGSLPDLAMEPTAPTAKCHCRDRRSMSTGSHDMRPSASYGNLCADNDPDDSEPTRTDDSAQTRTDRRRSDLCSFSAIYDEEPEIPMMPMLPPVQDARPSDVEENCALPQELTMEWIASQMVPFLQKGGRLSLPDAHRLVEDAIPALYAEQTIHDIEIAPNEMLIMVGDIHGQFDDMIGLFQDHGWPSRACRCKDVHPLQSAQPPHTCKFVFNGDIVDRGKNSVECLLTLLALKIVARDCLFITRGNHESLTCGGPPNNPLGKEKFWEECRIKYGPGDDFFDHCQDMFAALPLGAIINRSFFVREWRHAQCLTRL